MTKLFHVMSLRFRNIVGAQCNKCIHSSPLTIMSEHLFINV